MSRSVPSHYVQKRIKNQRVICFFSIKATCTLSYRIFVIYKNVNIDPISHLVDGNWSDWKDWSDCPVTCGGGMQERSRTCTNPPPQFGGKPCPGESEESRSCNEDPCPSNRFISYSFNTTPAPQSCIK